MHDSYPLRMTGGIGRVDRHAADGVNDLRLDSIRGAWDHCAYFFGSASNFVLQLFEQK